MATFIMPALCLTCGKRCDGHFYCTEHTQENRTDVDILTEKLINAGADRAKVIMILDAYGDPIDWTHYSLDSIIAEVWQSDANSGEDAENWIINEICRTFNVTEVKE